MANPNIVAVTTINGNTTVQSVTTAATAIVENGSSSGKVYKINCLIVSNIDGVNACDVNCYILDNSTSPAATGYLAFTVSIPADASLVLLTKNENTYLMENQTLFLGASAANDLSAVINYEDIT
jgi:hypothetical protein